jgi:hypothetical protein
MVLSVKSVYDQSAEELLSTFLNLINTYMFIINVYINIYIYLYVFIHTDFTCI